MEYKYQRGRLIEIVFSTAYPYPNNESKEYRLEETYGKGYVTYKLFDDGGEEVKLNTLPETAIYEDTLLMVIILWGCPSSSLHQASGRNEARRYLRGRRTI